MGLFGPKLTGEQKDLLRTVANTMNVLADRQKILSNKRQLRFESSALIVRLGSVPELESQ